MKADPKAETAAPAPSSKKKLIVMALMGLVIVAAGGTGAWWFLRAPGEHKEVPAGPPVFVALDTFVVNLQPEEGDAYLQTSLTLQVPTPEQEEVLKANMPKVRSRVLLLLSGKTKSEIATVEGKQQLTREIITSLHQPFVPKGPSPQVSDVMFTSFVIQ